MERHFDWKIIAKNTKHTYKKMLSTYPKDKTKYISSVPSLKIKEPVWFEEAKRKGRFLDRNYRPRGKFSYGVIEKGRAKIFR